MELISSFMGDVEYFNVASSHPLAYLVARSCLSEVWFTLTTHTRCMHFWFNYSIWWFPHLLPQLLKVLPSSACIYVHCWWLCMAPLSSYVVSLYRYLCRCQECLHMSYAKWEQKPHSTWQSWLLSVRKKSSAIEEELSV